MHVRLEIHQPAGKTAFKKDKLILQGKVVLRNISAQKIFVMQNPEVPTIYHTPHAEAVVFMGMYGIPFNMCFEEPPTFQALIIDPGKSHEWYFDLYYPIRENLSIMCPSPYQSPEWNYSIDDYEEMEEYIKHGAKPPEYDYLEDHLKKAYKKPDFLWNRLSVTPCYFTIDLEGIPESGHFYITDYAMDSQNKFTFEMSYYELQPFFKAANCELGRPFPPSE